MALTDSNVSPRPKGEERPGRIGAHIALVIVLLTTMLSYPQASRANSNPNNQPDQQHYNINVPQLNAAHALNRLAEQTGVTFLFPYSVAETQQANPVVGRFTLMQALKMLLQNTALSGGLTDSGVVMISRNDLNENGKGKRMNIKNKRNLLATFVTMFASGAMAQGVDGDQQAATQQSSIDEIIVTAQKKEERLLDVPISISVVSDEFIENAGISDLVDLAYAVPNLSVIETSPGVLTAAIRGVSNNQGTLHLLESILTKSPFL